MGSAKITNISHTDEGLLIEFSNNNVICLTKENEINQAKEKLKIGDEYLSFMCVFDIIKGGKNNAKRNSKKC